MGKQKQIDLFLYSSGGATMAAWGLVNLIREFCDKLCVLIPFKALSCATLVALGADEIVMTRTGQLSPVDPQVTSAFNPVVPGQSPGLPPQYLPVSVEDVVGFLNLIREEAKVKEENNITEVVKLLVSDVRPLALGSVYRAKQQIRMLSEKLLSFHMPKEQQVKIDAIVATLTRELYSHDYPIGPREARDVLGLKVVGCEDDLEKTIMELFAVYAEDMVLYKPHNAEVELGEKSTRSVTFERAFIESLNRSFVFRTRREVKKIRVMHEKIPLDAFQERVLEEGWLTLEASK